MSPPPRALAGALLVVAVLHVVASWAPGPLWGVSQLAAWPAWIGILWSALACGALGLAPRLAAGAPRLAFPGRRAALLVALAAGVAFWMLRERSHLFGDGSLLLRSGGLAAGTFRRAPLLVRPTVEIVGAARQHLGMEVATTMALLSVLAGAASVWLGLRLCAAATEERAGRFLLAAALGTAGALALFQGHVEYYALLVPPLLGWLLLAVHALHGRLPLWPTWLAWGVLLPLHLSALGLGLGQVFLGLRAWRRGERGRSAAALAAAAGLGAGLLRLAGSGERLVAEESSRGLGRYLAPYFDAAHSRHAFGFLSPAHLAAVANDLLLLSPLVLVTAVVAVAERAGRVAAAPPGAAAAERDVRRFLGLAALGTVLASLLFNRELGPYRDWDILAPYAFVSLAWAGAWLARGPALPARAMLVLVAGLHHLAPWAALHATPGAAETHLRLVLREARIWSPYARGTLHEELAIQRRDAGDLSGALADYAAASAAEPSDARYHAGLADIHARLGATAAAVREYETAIRIRPDWAPAHNNLAVLLANGDLDLERARRHALSAVRLDPDRFAHVMTLGFVEMRLGHFAAARTALARAEALQPGSPQVARRLEELRQLESER